MTQNHVSLICAELPGTEPSLDGDAHVWSAAGHPFVRVDPDGSILLHDGSAWTALDAPAAALKEPIREAYLALRHRLPRELRITLDRTSG